VFFETEIYPRMRNKKRKEIVLVSSLFSLLSNSLCQKSKSPFRPDSPCLAKGLKLYMRFSYFQNSVPEIRAFARLIICGQLAKAMTERKRELTNNGNPPKVCPEPKFS
jgi:hypothetical protein